MNIVWLISILALWALVLFLGFLLLGALRALGLVRWRLEQLEATTPSRIGRGGLKAGKNAPDFTLATVNGAPVSLHDFAGRKVLLVFMQPGCGPCDRVTAELNRLHGTSEAQVLAVQNGDPDSVRKWAEEHRPLFPVAVQQRYSLSKRYEAFATPFAFLIDERGVIASRGLASTRQYLGYILTEADRERDERHEDDIPSDAEKGTTASCLASVPSSNAKEVDHV
jgi:methylamine dehydrogenase accessory protein MauD